MLHTETCAMEEELKRPCNEKEKQKLQAIISAINTGGFGLGAILGPILASVLTDIYGYRISFTSAGILVFALSFLHLFSQFCYSRSSK